MRVRFPSRNIEAVSCPSFSIFDGSQDWVIVDNDGVAGDGFQFPVPLADIGTATLLAEDKALFFMRWIRRHLEVMEPVKS